MRTLNFVISVLLAATTTTLAADGNRLTYLDENNPYYPHLNFPKLITPQWVGEEGVEAVVILAIDDMRDPAKYEAYLRPILNRLKQIDGRAPVSIMTCNVKPDDPQLKQWLDEGLNFDVHTVDHPCPLLSGGDFAKARSTYDRCVDLLHEIPGNKPVAFRMPCCDSLNTVSPRFYAEIFNKTTPKGNFLSISSSVFNIFTSDDPAIPRELVIDADGQDKFLKYLPKNLKRGDATFNTFVNTIRNYPYPYVINRLCWEFPCVSPSDWSAQHFQKPYHPDTVRDLKAALDITVVKQGVYCLVFHPHGWIKNDQVVDLIDHAVAKHGKKVKFLNFREAHERLNKHVLADHGMGFHFFENGNRILDVDNDGFQDVILGGTVSMGGRISKQPVTRIWSPAQRKWNEVELPVGLTVQLAHNAADLGPKFGVLQASGSASFLLYHTVGTFTTPNPATGLWHFIDGKWQRDDSLNHFKKGDLLTIPEDGDGIRLRDIDGNGVCELIVGSHKQQQILQYDATAKSWTKLPFNLPAGTMITAKKRENGPYIPEAGLRFVDIDEDGHDDIVFSNAERYGIWLFANMQTGWSRKVLEAKRDDMAALPAGDAGAPRNAAALARASLPSPLAGEGAGKGGRASLGSPKPTPPSPPAPLPSRERGEECCGESNGRSTAPADGTAPPPTLRRGFTAPVRHTSAQLAQRPGKPLRQAQGGDGAARAPADKRLTLPPIVRADGSDNGFFVHSRHLFWQNEDTDKLLDLVDRRSFNELLAQADLPPQPKSPEGAMKSFQVRPGFQIELMAAEPLTMDPVAFEWGPDGKLWVAEMADYPLGIPDEANAPPPTSRRGFTAPVRKESDQLAQKPGEPLRQAQGGGGGRVRFLEDTDGDGKYDKSTLFLDGLKYPNGVMPWRNGVLISAAPDILFAADIDGDGRADVREVLYTGFTEGNQQHRVNGFSYGLDNWIYLANGDSGGTIKYVGPAKGKESRAPQAVPISGRDLRIRPDTGEVEAVAGQTQFGRNRDDWGNWFGCNNSNPMYQFVLDDHYQRRNPHFPSPSGKVDVPKVAGNAPVFPISQTLARFNDFHTANRFTSACSAMIYRDDLFGPQFAGNMFVSEPVHNLVHREIVSRDGVKFTSVRAPDEQQSEFLASTDNWFRPTMIKTGPDGALWIADMYRHVIEHPQWIPDTWQKRLDLRAGHDKGRIYCVFPVGAKPRPVKRLDKLKTDELIAALDSPSGWQRDTAQQLIINRLSQLRPIRDLNDPNFDKSVEWSVQTGALFNQAVESKSSYCRLHALCTLDGLNALSLELLIKALADKHAGVRQHAVRLSGSFVAVAKPQSTPAASSSRGAGDGHASFIVDALLKNSSDPDPQVRMQLAYTLGEIDDPRAGRVLGELLTKTSGDRFQFAATMSSINKTNVEQVLVGVLANRGSGTPNLNLVEGLLNLAAAFGNDQALVTLLTDVATPREGKFEPWQFAAVGGLLDTLDRQNKPLAKLSQSNDAALRGAIEKLSALFQAARSVSGDEQADAAVRVVTIRLLGHDFDNQVADLAALRAFLPPQTRPELQEAAIATLGRLNEPKAISLLIEHWRSFGPARRKQALDILLSREASQLQLIRAIDNETIAITEFDLTRRQRLTESRSEAVRRATAKLFTDTTNPDRQKVIDQYRPALDLAANPSRGAQLFAKTCAQCHKLKETGYEVGPDLASLTDKSPESLLVAMLDPNRAVETKFLSYAAITKAGLTFTGLLAAETGNSITLRAPEAKEQTILRADLDELVSTSKSTMPEGLEKDLQPQDIADIIAHVRANVPLPVRKEFAGNDPTLVKPAADDSLLLSASVCEIYGSTLVYEKQHGNLGYWSSLDDFALWNIEVAKPGKYSVEFDYACDRSVADINLWSLEVGKTTLTGRVPSTGNWETYKKATFGEIELPVGRQQLTMRAAKKIQGAMIDLRAIKLTLTK